MRNRIAAGLTCWLVAVAVARAEPLAYIVQSHTTPGPHAKLAKVLVLGISDDRETRHRFEDKLVTHLRGKGLAAVTSYSIVEDLSQPQNREVILAQLAEQKIEGIITVRAVSLDGTTELDWANAWSAWVDSPATIRELVERSIPVPPKAKKYGVEITLWELATGKRPWSARTGGYARRQLRESAGALMQETIARLREQEIF